MDRPKKFSDLSSDDVVEIESYKPVEGGYAKTSTKISDITKLEKIYPTEISNFLYEDSDFVVPPSTDGRHLVRMKAGKLYLQ